MEVEHFAYKVASAMNEIRSSHVFFILQQAFDDDYGGDLQWDDAQSILDEIISETAPKPEQG